MLPVPILDNEEFNEIMDDARNMIASLYPDWTDYNYHDPGITILEFFSWMKENQQYFMDGVSEQAREKFLKLLGERRRHKKASRVVVDIEPAEDVTVLKGSKLYAGDVCFLVEEQKQLVGADAVRWFFAQEKIEQMAERTSDGQRAPAINMFGRAPQAGDCFYICFDGPLPCGIELSLYLELAWALTCRRNPTQGGMAAPLAALSMEVFCAQGWMRVSDFVDETSGGIENGYLRFRLAQEQARTELFGVEGHYLRLRLLMQEYDVPPLVESVSINRLWASQCDEWIEQFEAAPELAESGRCSVTTHSMGALDGASEVFVASGDAMYQVLSFVKTPDYETGACVFDFAIPAQAGELDLVRIISDRTGGRGGRILAEGTGFPFQQYELDDTEIMHESFEIMVRSPKQPDELRVWYKVDDFSGSGREDRHYVFDSQRSTVTFGDCVHGLAPEGEILITSYKRTLGRNGDVTARRINRFEGLEPDELCVRNRGDSDGGCDEERLSDAFRRVREKLAFPETAISDADYERCVCKTPGLAIESCKVIPAEQARKIHKTPVGKLAVNIVVKPAGAGSLTPCYSKNILAHLEKYRAAGRRINLFAPSNIVFDVFADIVLDPQYAMGRESVAQAVEAFFQNLTGRFGEAVSQREFYGEIDRLPCVVRINSLNADAKGTGVVRSDDETVILPPNGVATLGEVSYLFGMS